MQAREAMAEGLRALLRQPVAATAALLGGATGALAERAASASAKLLVFRGVDGPWVRAAVLFLVGGSIGALLSAWSRAGAVAAATGTPMRDLLGAAVHRGIATISLGAVELTVIGTLVLFAFADATAVIALGRGPGISSAALAFACAPPLFCALLAAPAFRIAAARTAAGVPSHLALGEGLAIALRRLPALLGFGVLAVLVMAPLWLGALALGSLGSGDLPALARVVFVAASGAIIVAAWAWLHASLGLYVSDEISAERS